MNIHCKSNAITAIDVENFFNLEPYVCMQNIYEMLQDFNNMFEPNEIRIWTQLYMRNPLFLGK